MAKRVRVILVTDGDEIARSAVETAARDLGLRVISRSAGNPTRLTGEELVELCQQAPYDPVVVMVDDRGKSYKGKGETALEIIARHPRVEVIGAVAVASNTILALGARVDASVTYTGQLVPSPVDKDGTRVEGDFIVGDTVDVLENLDLPNVIGIGDIGKMRGADGLKKGAPITRRAIKEILRRSGVDLERERQHPDQ